MAKETNEVNEDSGMTWTETQIVSRTSEIYNFLQYLVDLNPRDKSKVVEAVNEIQSVFATRVATRTYPNYWKNN